LLLRNLGDRLLTSLLAICRYKFDFSGIIPVDFLIDP